MPVPMKFAWQIEEHFFLIWMFISALTMDGVLKSETGRGGNVKSFDM